MKGQDCASRSALLVIAGGTVSCDDNGALAAKAPMAQYLHELANAVGSCTWVTLIDNTTAYQSPIDSTKIRVVLVRRGWMARLRSWADLSRLALQHDLILYFLPNHYLPLLPLLRLRASRLIVYLAGDYEHGLELYKGQRWPGWSWLMRASSELPMRCADAVVARGRMLARVAGRFNNTVYETVPMGHMEVGTARSRCVADSATSRARRLLFIGKVVADKGVGDLLQALALLVVRHRTVDIALDVVGEGAERSAMIDAAQTLGLARIVSFHGWVSESSRIDTFFREADALIVPSRWGYPEGVPRVIDEAIVRCIPVVATPVGGIGDEYSDGEVRFVSPADPESLADGIDHVLFDGSTARRQIEGSEVRRRRLARYRSAARQHLSIILGAYGGEA